MCRVRCFEVALGAHDGDVTIRLAERSGHNSLLNVADPGLETVTLPVTRGDAWASANDVDHVDVLEIDSEGYDLEVLDGFDGLIAAGKVQTVLVECEFDRVRPEPHTSFFKLHDYLTPRGMGFTTVLYGFRLFEPVRLGQRALHPALASRRASTGVRTCSKRGRTLSEG